MRIKWFVMLCLAGIVSQGFPQDVKIKSAAVMRFEDRSSFPENAWMGVGFSETITTKLGLVEGLSLMERTKLNELLLAKGKRDELDETKEKEGEILRQILGVEYLLIGSIQTLGSYKDPNSQVKINARIIKTSTAAVKGDMAFSVSGSMNDLFRLETDMAILFSKALGVEKGRSEYEFEDAQSLTSHQLYGEGLKTYYDQDYKKAIELFREAVNKNEGVFFAAAHTMEGLARQKQIEKAAQNDKENLKKEYVEQFRKDASEAAPAFYDLGTAYQATASYEEAIKAYEEFLRYAGSRSRSQMWGASLNNRSFAVCNGRIYVGTDEKLMAYNASEFKPLWEAPIDQEKYIIEELLADSTKVYACASRRGSGNLDAHVLAFDGMTGKPLWNFKSAKNAAHFRFQGFGKGQFVFMGQDELIGIDVSTGKKSFAVNASSASLGDELIYVNRYKNSKSWVEACDYKGKTLEKGFRLEDKEFQRVSYSGHSTYLCHTDVNGWPNVFVVGVFENKSLWNMKSVYLDFQAAGDYVFALGVRFITAYDRSTGRQLWKWETQNRILQNGERLDGYEYNSNRVTDKYVIFCMTSGEETSEEIVALDAATGEVAFTKPFNNRVRKFEIDGQKLYVSNGTYHYGNAEGLAAVDIGALNDKKKPLYRDVDAKYAMALCESKMGHREEAYDLLKEIVASQPNYSKAWLALADWYHGMSEAEELNCLHEYFKREPFESVRSRVYELCGIADVVKLPYYQIAMVSKDRSNNVSVYYRNENQWIGEWVDVKKLETMISDPVRHTSYSFYNGFGAGASGPRDWKLSFLQPQKVDEQEYDANSNTHYYSVETNCVMINGFLYVAPGDNILYKIDLKKIDQLLDQNKKWWN